MLILTTLALLITTNAPASAATRNEWFFGKDAWVHGLQLNSGFLGHLGRATFSALPQGGLFLEARYGVWFHHLVEFNASAFKSVGMGEFWGAGIGGRLNVLEFSKANALDFSRETTAGLRCVETRRGILAWMLQSMVLHADVELRYFRFPPPDPSIFMPGQPVYDPAQLVLEWGGGIQWGFNVDVPRLTRIYLDVTVHFAQIAGGSYSLPYAGLGVNF